MKPCNHVRDIQVGEYYKSKYIPVKLNREFKIFQYVDDLHCALIHIFLRSFWYMVSGLMLKSSFLQ